MNSATGALNLSESEIREVQQVLIQRGLLTGEADGVLGPRTQEALISFQRQQGLDPVQVLRLGGGSILDGVLQRIEDGWYQAEISEAARQLERRVKLRPSHCRRCQPVHVKHANGVIGKAKDTKEQIFILAG